MNTFTTLPFNSHAFDFTSVQLMAMKRSFLSKICFPTRRKVRYARMGMPCQDVIGIECVGIRIFRSFETRRFLADIRAVPALYNIVPASKLFPSHTNNAKACPNGVLKIGNWQEVPLR